MTLHTEIPLLLSFLIYGEKIKLQDLAYLATWCNISKPFVKTNWPS